MKYKRLYEFIIDSWYKATVLFIEDGDHDRVKHVVISIIDKEESGYLYIHNDNLAKVYVVAKSHFYWQFIKDKMSGLTPLQLPSNIQEEDSVDPSLQAKPNLKMRKMSSDTFLMIVPWNIRGLSSAHKT
jgi:hypothetical protein